MKRMLAALRAVGSDDGRKTAEAQSEKWTRYESLFEVEHRLFIRSKYRILDALYDLTLPKRRVACLICGYAAVRESFATRVSECQFGGGKLERYVCPQCDALFGPMKMLDMSADELDDEYKLLYAMYAEADPTERELRTFDSLLPTHEKKYLNWGSGVASRSTEILRSRGFDIIGYEPTAQESTASIVRTREELNPTYDGIISNNVIEHFIDPVAHFQDFARLLTPQGRMAHSTPCYEYLYHNTRFHTCFFLGGSIKRLAESTGFEIVSREDDGDYINVVFQKSAAEAAS